MTNAPLIIGHRGAPGYRPEHSRAAYELAFALGADAVEPDIVATKDGVLVLRHENEISGTTDVAAHPEFVDRRTTKLIDGEKISGWFTEDFTWSELTTLRSRERLPDLRQASASFDGRYPILRLKDLLELIDEQSAARGRDYTMVAEIKHATHFHSVGLPLDELFAAEVEGWAARDRLIVESFEQGVLGDIRARGVEARYVFLANSTGTPADLVARLGSAAPSYAEHLTTDGLALLATALDGVSVDKHLLLSTDAAAATIAAPELVARAHAAGLTIYTWTLRPENHFLSRGLRGSGGTADWGRWHEEFALLIGTGVDGVFADHPDLVVAALAAL